MGGGADHESLSFQGLAYFVFLILYSFWKEAPANKNFRAPLHYGLSRVPQNLFLHLNLSPQ